MESSVTFLELAQVSGELLPDRLLMSSVVPPLAGGGAAGAPEAAGGTTVYYACQLTQNPGPPPLLALVGLAPSSPGYTISCIPAVVSTSH